MNRQKFLASLATLAAAAPLASCLGSGTEPDDEQEAPELYKSMDEWKSLVSAPAFDVLFQEGTEEPYSSPLNAEHGSGTFVCAACFNPLFEAAAKYESGTGWPSFWKPLDNRLGLKADKSGGMTRTEYHCHRCGGHQGHVFDDGPAPTGKRYCNNGVALQFVPTGEALPPLRT